jgi:glycosyltransferase involved in cell wall biosynthesis
MRVGFDAKRAFFNHSGLGNYSRSTIELLVKEKPEHDYFLFTPNHHNTSGFEVPPSAKVVYPRRIIKMFEKWWRYIRMGRTLREHNIDLYHGLSNELPNDIRHSKARSVVTMHDIIFVRYPKLYKPWDRWLYTRKYRRSCNIADRIIAISQQTKNDLVRFWNIDPQKIDIVYQGCNPIFYQTISDEGKKLVRKKYNLPERFILSVGTVEERKNLMLVVKAMAKGGIRIPLVVCGKWTPYKEQINVYAEANGIDHLLHFYKNINSKDLPAIYQMSECLVYVSIFEGFGIPILEAMNSHIPVITSRGGVFPETGGDACIYIDPSNVDEMLGALTRVLNDDQLRDELIKRGIEHAKNFREEQIAENLIKVYEKTLNQ